MRKINKDLNIKLILLFIVGMFFISGVAHAVVDLNAEGQLRKHLDFNDRDARLRYLLQAAHDRIFDRLMSIEKALPPESFYMARLSEVPQIDPEESPLNVLIREYYLQAQPLRNSLDTLKYRVEKLNEAISNGKRIYGLYLDYEPRLNCHNNITTATRDVRKGIVAVKKSIEDLQTWHQEYINSLTELQSKKTKAPTILQRLIRFVRDAFVAL